MTRADAGTQFGQIGFAIVRLSSLLTKDVESVWDALNSDVLVEEKRVRELPREIASSLMSVEGFVRRFATDAGFRPLRLEKVRVQRSVGPLNLDPAKAPFATHVDRRRFIKLMVYMTDVDLSHGPLTFDLGSPYPRRRKLREVWSSNAHGLNVVGGSPKPVPVTGRRGTAIIFDTNAAHFAGFREPDLAREIVRFDFSSTSWIRRTLRTL